MTRTKTPKVEPWPVDVEPMTMTVLAGGWVAEPLRDVCPRCRTGCFDLPEDERVAILSGQRPYRVIERENGSSLLGYYQCDRCGWDWECRWSRSMFAVRVGIVEMPEYEIGF